MKILKSLSLLLVILTALSCNESDEIFTVIGNDSGSDGNGGGLTEDINTFNLKSIESQIEINTSYEFQGVELSLMSNVYSTSSMDETGALTDIEIIFENSDPITGTTQSNLYEGDITYDGESVVGIDLVSTTLGSLQNQYGYNPEGQMTSFSQMSNNDPSTQISCEISYPSDDLVIVNNVFQTGASTITLSLNNNLVTQRKITFSDSSNEYIANITYDGNNISSVTHMINDTTIGQISYTYDSQLNPVRPLYYGNFGYFFFYPYNSMVGLDEASLQNNYNLDIENYTMYMSENNINNSFYTNLNTTGVSSLEEYSFANSYNGDQIQSRDGSYTANITVPIFNISGTIANHRIETYTYH